VAIDRFEPDELPGAIARMVWWRWPGERLLATAPCLAEWQVADGGWDPEPAREPVLEPGALGVTERRLIYRTLERHGVALRAAAWLFLSLAVIGVLIREPTMTPAAAVLAPVLWVAARVLETLGVGAGSIELSRVLEVDHRGHRIHGVDRWGTHYHLRLSEPDFGRVATLVAP
jgi:hypothetical protein